MSVKLWQKLVFRAFAHKASGIIIQLCARALCNAGHTGDFVNAAQRTLREGAAGTVRDDNICGAAVLHTAHDCFNYGGMGSGCLFRARALRQGSGLISTCIPGFTCLVRAEARKVRAHVSVDPLKIVTSRMASR